MKIRSSDMVMGGKFPITIDAAAPKRDAPAADQGGFLKKWSGINQTCHAIPAMRPEALKPSYMSITF